MTRTLLVRLTQNRWSGRVSTALRLASVGGQGSDAGWPEILPLCLKTLARTRYSGTKNTALTQSAADGAQPGDAVVHRSISRCRRTRSAIAVATATITSMTMAIAEA